VLSLLSLVILALGLSLVALTIAGTFEHKYDRARRIFTETFEEVPVGLSDIKNLKGNIVSIQLNESNLPVWIATGRWRADDSTSNSVNDSSKLVLSANITMVGTNGTAEHKHRISDFKLTNLTFTNREAILNGTASLITQGKSNVGVAPSLTKVPISIKIENLRTIGISIDKKAVNHHFGESPIFGTVTGTSAGP